MAESKAVFMAASAGVEEDAADGSGPFNNATEEKQVLRRAQDDAAMWRNTSEPDQ